MWQTNRQQLNKDKKINVNFTIDKNLYERFKLNTVNTKMTLQKLTNRSVDRFLTDKKYREEIETYDNLTVSGSNF